MDKYVIMFKGGVETQEYFSIEMARTFEENGYQVYWFDLVICAQSARVLRRFYEHHQTDEFVMFTFNFHGIAGEEGLYDTEYRTGNFWDDAGIHVYNMVVDHPLYYHKYMPLIPEKYTQLSIDRNHIRYMQQYFPTVDLGGALGFVPLGGTQVNEGGRVLPGMRYLPMDKRSIDVIFTGNYTPPQRFEKFIAHMEQEYIDFYHGLVQEAIAHPQELIEDIACQQFEEALGKAVTADEMRACMPNMMFVDLSVRFFYRAKVIAALADSGVQVHTFGAGWNLLECRHPENIIQAGSVDSQECLDRISQSKLSVNVMPWFKDGAHDRIFNSMLNGAVCVSDPSKYLTEQFTDGRDIAFYALEQTDAIGERVQELLASPAKLQEMADCAYEKCADSHTWKNRTEQVLLLIERRS